MIDNRSEPSETRDGVACCGRQGQLFWGVVLLLFGGILLLGTHVSLIGLGKYLLPAFLILWGGWKVWTAARLRVNGR